MSRVFLLVAWIFSFLSTYGQDPRSSDWHTIDSNINKKNHLTDVNEQLQERRKLALAEKKYFRVARTYYYQLRIADQRTEDSFYFRNSAFIDSILATQVNPELELAMHLLQAKRLAGFASGTGSMRFNRQRYERRDIPINYAAYTDRQLDSLAQWHCEQAKKLEKNISNQKLEEILWLSSDPWVFLFRPGLFDIIIGEQIGMLKKPYYTSQTMDTKQLRSLSLSQDEFIEEIESIYNKDYLLQLKYYKEWLDHQRGNPSAYYFIETLARKFLYDFMTRKYSEIDQVKTNYEGYLSVISSSPYSTVKAYAVYQLCLLWNQDSKKYFPFNKTEYDSRTRTYVSRQQFDTLYRYHAVKALRLYEKNELMLDSFSYLKVILAEMKEQILETDLTLSLESYNLPGEPILTQLNFKNATRLFYRVVRVKNDFPYSNYGQYDDQYEILKQKPQEPAEMIDLPVTNDFNRHTTLLKLDALPAGSYVIVFSHLPLSDTSEPVESVFFSVTSIAVLQENKRVFVLDRKTGLSLRAAKVKGSYLRDRTDTLKLTIPVTKIYTVNEQGFIEIQDKKIRELEVYYNNDTAYSTVTAIDDDENEYDDAYSKDEYDDLAEYYEENTKVEIFTDRSIYRPGQTVYFKALFTTLDPKTGQPIVISRQNMKGSLFNNAYKKWLKRDEPELYLVDPFNNKVDTIRIKLNDYGSLSGSFKLPKAATPGEWSLEPDYLEVSDDNEGVFQVEEYKRPTYDVSIETPKKELLPGDSFTVRLKVKSFAGAALNNVRINYRVERGGDYSIYDSVSGKTTWMHNEEVIKTSGYTNADGELEILVNDAYVQKYSRDNDQRWDFSYHIDAEATDLTSETFEAEASVNISSMPISIRVPVESSYDRGTKNSVVISASDLNAGMVSKDINVKVYRIIKVDKPYIDRKLMVVDQWVYEKQQLEQWFPLVNFNGNEDTGTRKLLFEQMVNTGKNGKIDFDPAVFPAGNYMIEATRVENGHRRGYSKRVFTVFDEKENKMPQRSWTFYRLPLNSFSPGDTVKYLNGNSESPVYSVYYLKYFSTKKKGGVGYLFENRIQEPGITRWQWKIPAEAGSQAILTQFYVLNNQLFTHSETIYINYNSIAEPEIIVEQYRKKLSPGAKENFVVSIKTKNENIAAELMTTLYDASLDKLEPHKWTKPLDRRRGRYLRGDRSNYINSSATSFNYYYSNYDDEPSTMRGRQTSALWWVNSLSRYYDDEPMYEFSTSARRMNSLGSTMLEGRAAGVSLTNADGLNEVVVVGYGVSKKMDVTGSVVRIRGVSSLSSYSQPLIILDGVPYEGDLSKLDPGAIRDGLVLKGADAVAIYGSRAANGVLVLSTKGPVVLPELPPDPPLPPRKNFNETAFFFPAVHADKDGFYRISFTMPESVTEWNWKMLAHTKRLQFAYAEKKLNTQLPLMVQPNMPRLLFQGDRIVLQSRISNLDSTEVNGKAICRVEDLVTGEDLTPLFVTGAEKDFSVGKKSNLAIAFEIKIPATQLNPVKIIVSARSKNFSDGEEHVIPVLSPKVLVKESIPFRFSKNMDTILQSPSIPAGAELYGIGLSILTKPQAALINALPYLANYSFDCAEQTFNKLLANTTAFWLMRNDREAQRSFDKAKQSVDKLPEQKEQLPDELGERSMPWLNLQHRTVQQQQQLFNLLDTGRTMKEVERHLDKLYKLQNSDGGLTWFEGGRSNSYISCYVLAGFGKLEKDGLLLPRRSFGQKYDEFINKLVTYCDNHYIPDARETGMDPFFYAYARSFWNHEFRQNDSILASLRQVLDKRWKKLAGYGLYNQVVLIISTLRYFDKGTEQYTKAVQQLESIAQLAINDEVNGTRWKDIADSDDISNTSEETFALLAAAFSEAGVHPELAAGMTKWVLTAKNDEYWSSTKATSAAIGLLFKENNTATGPSQMISSKIGLSATDDLLSGNGFSFVKTNSASPIELKKQNSLAASGSLLWYYFSPADQLAKANRDVLLTKELFRYNQSTSQWDHIDESTSLKIADKIKVVLTIETSKALKYVYIDDKRAAAFEPADNHSGYEYATGLSYYRSVRDEGLQFFIDYIESGRSVISYEMIVAHEGYFSNGPASLQCMYKPELNAYSNGIRVQTSR